MEQVRMSPYLDLAHDLEIDKAIGFLKQKDFGQVFKNISFVGFDIHKTKTLKE